MSDGSDRINYLTFRNLGIDTNQEHIVFMKKDCEVCVSEGFESLTRVRVSTDAGRSVVCTLNVVTSSLLNRDEISLSERAREKLEVTEGDTIQVSHLEPIHSLSLVRKKIHGKKLNEEEFTQILEDITEGIYSNIHTSSFVTACAGNLNTEEILGLTRAMVKNGDQISWPDRIVADKHSIGGLPGNRTTPIIVPIVASCGIKIPKTSSRAITSPAGTADVMEVMTNVTLTNEQIRSVVEEEGGCMTWGGAASLSPADDIIIRVERALDLDSEEQMIASVLSKKAAAGSSHVIIDIPVGETAKVRSRDGARHLKQNLMDVSSNLDLTLGVEISDGRQPVGRGIGPALEARDVLSVLRNEDHAPDALREKSVSLSGKLLELTGYAENGEGASVANEKLESGEAREKFMAICRAQGGFREPEEAPFVEEVTADRSGVITEINNRKLARVAKLAGAPADRKAGIQYYGELGRSVDKGDLLLAIHAESRGELRYAREYLEDHKQLIQIE